MAVSESGEEKKILTAKKAVISAKIKAAILKGE